MRNNDKREETIIVTTIHKTRLEGFLAPLTRE